MIKRILTVLVLFVSVSANSQEVLDKVIGVVGKYPVLMSELQNAMLDEESAGLPADKCKSYEMLVFQKLLVAQADRDSVTVSDQEVETELNRRMAYYVQKFGSEEKLEKFYGKRTNVLKDELRGDVQEKMLAEKMRNKILGETKLTPAEIRLFYQSIPQDSLPFINSEVELQQLVKKPEYSVEARTEARERIEGYRQRVLNGERTISMMARAYSEDPGSASRGGLYENVARGVMDPAFEAVAFRLKKGEVSNVFETPYGYHFMQLEQRKGELLDIRHILVTPKMTNEDYFRCKRELDTLYRQIKEGKLKFEEAVRRYSDDSETKQNDGLMVNPQNASTKFDNELLNQMDERIVPVINGLQIGEISTPSQYNERDGRPAFRIIKLKNRVDPHRANLKDDYQRISAMATEDRNQKQIKEWIKRRSKNTYIKLDSEFACRFENEWTISN